MNFIRTLRPDAQPVARLDMAVIDDVAAHYLGSFSEFDDAVEARELIEAELGYHHGPRFA